MVRPGVTAGSMTVPPDFSGKCDIIVLAAHVAGGIVGDNGAADSGGLAADGDIKILAFDRNAVGNWRVGTRAGMQQRPIDLQRLKPRRIDASRAVKFGDQMPWIVDLRGGAQRRGGNAQALDRTLQSRQNRRTGRCGMDSL